MAKRGAQSTLDHLNWNEADAPEEVGEFAKASEDVIKQRVIKKARRRVAGDADSTATATASVFGGFKGFQSTPVPKTDDKAGGTKSFSFLATLGANGNGTGAPQGTTSPKAAKDTNKVQSFTNLGSTFGPKPTASDKPAAASQSVDDANATFQANVVALNKTFVEWISAKVTEGPFCKLHVVFRDYEKHFAQLEAEKVAATGTPAQLAQGEKQPESEKEKAKAPEKKTEPDRAKEQEKEKPSFSFAKPPTVSFGTTPASSVPTTSPSFFAGASTFGSKPATPGTSSLFGSSTSGGLTFGTVAKPTANSDAGGKEEGADGDEDEPPKVEFTPVEEKDSLYSKRCKLFVKAGGSFSDRGIGTLHVKKVDSKVQLLVRAETSLGNILLNIILNETVPLQRMGKNNVMMVCLPTPESKPPPTSVLLRVKTAEEADELHETLLKYKPK
uniref:RanBD1 domain-containing protein n=1 Tax=Anopheles atroparvus TaxID=41427 RepID=A0AAG5DDJ1_ANOAO